MPTSPASRVLGQSDTRQRIVSTAGELFVRHGFRNVSMAQVAGALDMTAPSLYHHFASKQDLLLCTVGADIESMARLVHDAPNLDSALCRSAARAVAHRDAATLWQREARHLPAEGRAILREQFILSASRLSQLVGAERQDLSRSDSEFLGWVSMSVFGSVSTHRATLPRRRFESLLVALARAGAHAELGQGTTPATDRARSRAPGATSRELLLTAAIRLFGERGYQSVTTDEIGAAAGMTGPNIYRHFPAKIDLLVAAVARASARRDEVAAVAVAGVASARTRLDRLLSSYVEFALEHRPFLTVLISEPDQLPEHARRAERRAQRDYLALWLSALDGARPGLDTDQLRITLNAALSTVSDAVRIGHSIRRPDLSDRLQEVCLAILLDGSAPAP